MKKYIDIFTNGLLKENPLLVLMIGLCSSLAVTTSFTNGLGMGLAMTFVLVMSEGTPISSISPCPPWRRFYLSVISVIWVQRFPRL